MTVKRARFTLNCIKILTKFPWLEQQFTELDKAHAFVMPGHLVASIIG